jgi:hypothetical protein
LRELEAPNVIDFRMIMSGNRSNGCNHGNEYLISMAEDFLDFGPKSCRSQLTIEWSSRDIKPPD